MSKLPRLISDDEIPAKAEDTWTPCPASCNHSRAFPPGRRRPSSSTSLYLPCHHELAPTIPACYTYPAVAWRKRGERPNSLSRLRFETTMRAIYPIGMMVEHRWRSKGLHRVITFFVAADGRSSRLLLATYSLWSSFHQQAIRAADIQRAEPRVADRRRVERRSSVPVLARRALGAKVRPEK